MPHSLDLSDKTALLHQQMYGIPQRDFRSWCAQRDDALAHHIPFRFSLLQWRLWWLHEMGGADVRIKQRFRAGHCVMVRIGGRGAYEPGNVRCVVRDGDGPDVPLPVKDRVAGNPAWLAGVDGNPRNVAVIGPDGRRWASMSLAAEGYGVTVSAISHRLRRKSNGWRRA